MRIYVLTDGISKTKSFKPHEIGEKSVLPEGMDIGRLHRHLSEGKPRDELAVNFEEAFGSPLLCVYRELSFTDPARECHPFSCIINWS